MRLGRIIKHVATTVSWQAACVCTIYIESGVGKT